MATARLPLHVIPVPAVTRVLSYLHITDKLKVTRLVPEWETGLHFFEAWENFTIFLSPGSKILQPIFLCDLLEVFVRYRKFISYCRLFLEDLQLNALGDAGTVLAAVCKLQNLSVLHIFTSSCDDILAQFLRDLSSPTPRIYLSVTGALSPYKHLQELSHFPSKLISLAVSPNSILPHTVPGVINKLSCFTSLRKLKVPSGFLTDQIIENLYKKSLRCLTVHCNSEYGFCSPINWVHLSKVCSSLVVHHVTQGAASACSVNPLCRSVLFFELECSPDVALPDAATYQPTAELVGLLSVQEGVNVRDEARRAPQLMWRHLVAFRHVQTLIISLPVHATDVLLIAKESPQLKELCIPRDEIIDVWDFSFEPDWTDDLLTWLQSNSVSRASIQKEVGVALGREWRLQDHEGMRCLMETIVGPLLARPRLDDDV